MKPVPDIDAQEKEMAQGNPWGGLLSFCVAALVMLGAAVFMFHDLFTTLIVGGVIVVSLVGFVNAIRGAASVARFGNVTLRLAEQPPAIGGRLVARALLPEGATRAGSVFANLECQMVTYDNEGGRTVLPLWRKKRAYAVRPGVAGDLEVQFDLPTDLPPANDDPRATSKKVSRGYAAWELKLSARLQSVDFVRTYSIPVQPAAPATLPTARPAVAPEKLVEFIPRGVQPEAPPAAPAADGAAMDKTSAWVLVAGNLVPLAGVVWLGWKVHEIVFIYWIETLIVGAFNVLRMIFAGTADGVLAKSRSDVIAGKIMFTAFFIVHYGGFCFLYGDLLSGLFPPPGGGEMRLVSALGQTLGAPLGLGAVLAIFASHAYSFVRNYIRDGEYRSADSRMLMFQPYRRIFLTAGFIFLGGIVGSTTGSPVAVMIVFVALKIAVDVFSHRRERMRLAPKEKKNRAA